MSNSPKVTIWVGVSLEEMGYEENILPHLPPEIEKGCGLRLIKIRSDYQIIGFGVAVFSHDWNDGNVEFDGRIIDDKASDLQHQVATTFRKWGITIPVGIYITSDYR